MCIKKTFAFFDFFVYNDGNNIWSTLMNEENIALEHFLNTYSPRILHEPSVSVVATEHFFVSVNKVNYMGNPRLKSLVEAHKNNYPLMDISMQSISYIVNDPEYDYLWLASCNKLDSSYSHRLEYMRKNVVNHLCVMWFGEPYNKETHNKLNYDLNVQMAKAKAASTAKEIANSLKAGVKEKAPILASKIRSIFKR